MRHFVKLTTGEIKINTPLKRGAYFCLRGYLFLSKKSESENLGGAPIFFSKIAIFSGACGALGTENTFFSSKTPLKTLFFVARLRRAENPFKNGRAGVHLFLSKKSNPENLWGAPIFVQKISRIHWGAPIKAGVFITISPVVDTDAKLYSRNVI